MRNEVSDIEIWDKTSQVVILQTEGKWGSRGSQKDDKEDIS